MRVENASLCVSAKQQQPGILVSVIIYQVTKTDARIILLRRHTHLVERPTVYTHDERSKIKIKKKI